MVATYSRDDLRAGRADWIANLSTLSFSRVDLRMSLRRSAIQSAGESSYAS